MKTQMVRKISCIILTFVCVMAIFSTTRLDAAAAQTGTVKVDGLNIREQASMKSDIIGSLFTGDKVTIKGTKGSYYKISYDGKTAYVGKSYITVGSSKSSKSNNSSSSSKQKGTITANSLTVRKSASASSKKLGYLSKGDKVTIKGTKGNFYKITYNGKTAYVSQNYVSTESSSSSKKSGQAVVDYAEQFVGNPYVTGGTSLTKGADCSGFVMSVYKHFGVSLPHSSYGIRSYGKAVSRSNVQPGDVICYNGHVAIYAGNGRTVGARNHRAGIGYSNAWYTNVITIRRFF